MYVLAAIVVAVLVLVETWLDYSKLNAYDPDREDMFLVGIGTAIFYGLFWPFVMILFVLGRILRPSTA